MAAREFARRAALHRGGTDRGDSPPVVQRAVSQGMASDESRRRRCAKDTTGDSAPTAFERIRWTSPPSRYARPSRSTARRRSRSGWRATQSRSPTCVFYQRDCPHVGPASKTSDPTTPGMTDWYAQDKSPAFIREAFYPGSRVRFCSPPGIRRAARVLLGAWFMARIRFSLFFQ